jgi:hypothetical protein
VTMNLSINRKKMGDAHERFLAKLFGGRQTRGSGNQWKDPADGRNDHHESYAFAWDGKSTLSSSISISRMMWAKIVEQAHGERPMLAVRFYDNSALDVGYDLAIVRADDLAEMRAELLANQAEIDRLNTINTKLAKHECLVTTAKEVRVKFADDDLDVDW